jgi:hypothetical protein
MTEISKCRICKKEKEVFPRAVLTEVSKDEKTFKFDDKFFWICEECFDNYSVSFLVQCDDDLKNDIRNLN